MQECYHKHMYMHMFMYVLSVKAWMELSIICSQLTLAGTRNEPSNARLDICMIQEKSEKRSCDAQEPMPGIDSGIAINIFGCHGS